MTELSGADLVKRWESLKSARGSWEEHWQEVLDYVLPRKADVVTLSPTPGRKKTERQFDATAAFAAHDLAAALATDLTPRDRPWFELDVPALEGSRAVRAWLFAARERVAEEFAASNFYTAIQEAYLDLVTVGTCCLSLEEKPIRKAGFNGFAFQAVHVGEFAIDEDAIGQVDTVIRRFELSARQAVQMFSLADDALPDKIRDRAKEPRTEDEKFEFVHACFPRADAAPGVAAKDKLPVASYYVALCDRSIVRAGGYHELPYAVARWSKTTRELYGRSPAMSALPDIKVLNLMVRYELEALPLALYPPFLIKEGTLTAGQLKLTPGAQNHWDGREDEKPTQIDWRGNVQLDLAKAAEYRERILRAFHADVLRLKDAPQMTAAEVFERKNQRNRALIPISGRVEGELLTRTVERSFLLMVRAGAFGPPPEELMQGGANLQVGYISPLAQAQKLAQVSAGANLLGLFGSLMAAKPELLDNVNADRMLCDAAEIMGLPPDYLVDPKVVQGVRAARAKAMQQQAEIAATLQATETGAKAARAMQ